MLIHICVGLIIILLDGEPEPAQNTNEQQVWNSAINGNVTGPQVCKMTTLKGLE